MSENENKSVMIKCVNDLCQTWGIKQKDLAAWMGTSGSTISGWNDYKWRTVSSVQIKLVAMYYGENIRDANDLKETFRSLLKEQKERNKEKGNGDAIVNTINSSFNDSKLEKEINEAHKIVIDKYLEITEGEVNSTSVSESIKGFMEEKYPSVFKRNQIEIDDTGEQPEDTENDMPEEESSPKQSEDTENGMPEAESSPKQPETVENDMSEAESSPKQSETVENDMSEVESSPKQSETVENDTPEAESGPKQSEDTENGMPEAESSPKQPETVENDMSEVESSPKQSETVENDTPEAESGPKQSEDTENGMPEAESSPKQPETVENDMSEEESSPKQPEDTEKHISMEEDAIKLPPGGNNFLKAQKEYKKAKKLGKKNKERIERLRIAAELGHRDANFELGLAYEYGEGVNVNPSKAVEYFFKAGKLGSGDAVYELKECYQKHIGVEKKQAGRKEMWLTMVLKNNHYEQTKHAVDISMDSKLSSKERAKYVKKWHEFVPETDEERKLKELIEIWGGINN